MKFQYYVGGTTSGSIGDQSSPTSTKKFPDGNCINDIPCVSANFQGQLLDMFSPYYQTIKNQTSLVNGDLVALKGKYRAVPVLAEIWERLFDFCVVECLGEMVTVHCGISNEDLPITDVTNYSSSASEEISKPLFLLAQMRRQVTFTTDTVSENLWTSKENRV